MTSNHVSVNETIESADRCLVAVRGRPGEEAWTIERTIWCGSVVSYKVEFRVTRDRKTVLKDDIKVLSRIPMPPAPQPWWADPAVAMPELLPSNVVPFPCFSPLTIPTIGGRA